MSLRALGVGFVLLTPSHASAETLCVRGPVYVEGGEVDTMQTEIVKRGLKVECPMDTREIVQEGRKRPLTSTEIKAIREKAE